MAYEAEHPGSEIHKGAPTFNMGVVCLRSHDFAGAMQFFEIAEQETIKTTGKRDWRIFLNELFEKLLGYGRSSIRDISFATLQGNLGRALGKKGCEAKLETCVG